VLLSFYNRVLWGLKFFVRSCRSLRNLARSSPVHFYTHQGHRQRVGQWCLPPPFKICALHFMFGPRFLRTSNIVFKKCGPPCGSGHPAAKSWQWSWPAPLPHFFCLKPAPVRKLLKTHIGWRQVQQAAKSSSRYTFHWQQNQNFSTHLIYAVNRVEVIKTMFQSGCHQLCVNAVLFI